MHENTETRRVAEGEIPVRCRLIYLPRYVVIPAGRGFFHITEYATGRVKGFRRTHNAACALARTLEH
ncbi:hypothetical protein DCO48_17415 [Pseudomonas sp. SDI]|nr:hypothetical protein DCO48_17415 [Pseudomonas sp. SDI]